MKKLVALLAVGIALVIPKMASAAIIIQVDLSTTTGPKVGLTNWNYLMPNSSIGAGSVIDANGSVVSGLSVAVNGTGADNNPDTLGWPGFGNDPYYVPEAYDLIWTNNPGLGLLGTASELNVTFSGLDTSKTYNARLYFLINEGLSNFDAAVSGEGGMVRNNNINRVQVFSQPFLDSRLIFNNIAPTTLGGNIIASVGASQPVSLEAIVLEEYTAAVPEPGQVAASLLLLAGIGGYVWIKRRKTAKPVAVAAA
jgi:hypothetical protein